MKAVVITLFLLLAPLPCLAAGASPATPPSPDPLIDAVLELRLREGMLLKVFIDPEQKRIGLVEGTIPSPAGSTGFRTEYSDYRTVEGILFAFHEENFASGFQTGTTVIRSVILNPKTTEKDFRP
jgi:hypothetical protein